MSSLQNELTRLIGVVENLADTERAKVDDQVARITAMENDLRANMPITSNMWPDTRKFAGLCDGQLETPMTFEEGAFGSQWGLVKNSSEANITVEVIPAVPSLLKARGLHWDTSSPIIALAGAEFGSTDTYRGSDFNIAIFDIEAVSSSHATYSEMALFYFVHHHNSAYYTGWNRSPGCRVQTSCFFNVMEYVGDGIVSSNMPFESGFGLGSNRFPQVYATKEDLGSGWIHRKTTHSLMRGADQSSFGVKVGDRIKVAVALPYVGLGDHGDSPVWSDYGGQWTHVSVNDHIDGRI